MIRIIVRSLIVSCIVICMGIYAGVSAFAFVGAIMCVCAWISVRDIGVIDRWIVFLGLCMSIGWYDMWGVQFLLIIGVAYMFNVIRGYLSRNNSDNVMWLFLTAISLGFLADMLMKIITVRYIVYEPSVYFVTFVVSLFAFGICVWIIDKSERFIDLYVQDVQGHM